jgi:hypothetical protein
MIDQQLQLPVDAFVRARSAQVRFPERRPRDRERVDPVRLAARPAGAPLAWAGGRKCHLTSAWGPLRRDTSQLEVGRCVTPIWVVAPM